MAGLVDDALILLKQARTLVSEAETRLGSLAESNRLPPHTTSALEQIRASIATAQTLHVRVAEALIRIERRQTREEPPLLDQGVYWRAAPGGTRQGPYCPQCWNEARRTTLLRNLPFRGHDRWVCGTCQKSFFSEGAKQALNASQRAAASRQPGLQADEE